MQAIRSSVAASIRRDMREPLAPTERPREERVTFRWRRDILGGHSFYCPTLSDDSGRDTREEIAGSTGDTGASRAATQESKQVVGKKDHRKKKPPQTLTPATVERELEPSKRLVNSIESIEFQENAFLEWMTCLSCGAH